MRTEGTALRPGPVLVPDDSPPPHRPSGPPAQPSRVVRGTTWVLLALICALAVTLLAPTTPRPPDREPHAPVTCALPAPATAGAYTTAFAHLSGGWLAGDQVSSTPLPGGRILWLFADTLTSGGGPGREAGIRFVHSSFVVQSAGCFAPSLGPSGDGVVPAPGRDQWYWPQHAVVAGERLWVTALRVARGQPSPGSFELRGVDLAEFELADDGTPHFVAMHRTPASTAGDFGVLWGTALAVDGDVLYVYGTRRVADPLVGRQLLLARVPLSRVAETTAWQFRTGDAWSADRDDAVVLVPAEGGVSTALSAHRSTAGWVLVTKRDDFLGDAVVALVGDAPWGPFDERVLFDSTPQGGRLEYLPMAHPEAALADGSLLVSVSHNSTSLATVLRDPGTFRPTFHAVRGLGRAGSGPPISRARRGRWCRAGPGGQTV